MSVIGTILASWVSHMPPSIHWSTSLLASVYGRYAGWVIIAAGHYHCWLLAGWLATLILSSSLNIRPFGWLNTNNNTNSYWLGQLLLAIGHRVIITSYVGYAAGQAGIGIGHWLLGQSISLGCRHHYYIIGWGHTLVRSRH